MKNLNFNITVSELAKICNVSAGTVDRALNNRGGISPKTKAKILSVAKEYGYIEKSKDKPKLIGIVLFDLYNDYFSELVMSFEEESKKQGYSIVVMFTDKDCKKEIDCIKSLYRMGVSGIILCPINKGEDFENFIKSFKIPVITVGNRLKGVPYVGTDNFAAMYDAAKFVGEKKENVIYFSPAIKSENNNYAQAERFKGFCAACKDMGFRSYIAISVDEIEGILEGENRKKFAILCSSDYYLIQIAAKYPDLFFMGFDNSPRLKGLNVASVDCDSHGVAKTVLKSIMNNKKEDVIIRYKVIK